jgi:thymidylate kinase
MLLASFTGAQSTGKSTLLDMCMDLLIGKSETTMFPDKWVFIPEVTRLIKRQYGVDINEQGTDDTQLLILNQHLINTIQFKQNLREKKASYMMDRCIMDGYVYSRYLHNHGRLEDSTMSIAESMYERLLPSLDIIFYTHPEQIPIDDDGERSVDPQFREEIIQIYNDLLYDNQKWMTLHNVVVLRGNPEERMDTIKRKLYQFGSKI